MTYGIVTSTKFDLFPCLKWNPLLILFQQGRNVLFNNALNPFLIQLYGIEHMVKDYSES